MPEHLKAVIRTANGSLSGLINKLKEVLENEELDEGSDEFGELDDIICNLEDAEKRLEDLAPND